MSSHTMLHAYSAHCIGVLQRLAFVLLCSIVPLRNDFKRVITDGGHSTDIECPLAPYSRVMPL
jgi:hypothetical protein